MQTQGVVCGTIHVWECPIQLLVFEWVPDSRTLFQNTDFRFTTMVPLHTYRSGTVATAPDVTLTKGFCDYGRVSSSVTDDELCTPHEYIANL